MIWFPNLAYLPNGTRKGGSVSHSFTVMGHDDSSFHVLPASHPTSSRVAAGSPYDTSASHHLSSAIHTPYSIEHDPNPITSRPTTTPTPSRLPCPNLAQTPRLTIQSSTPSSHPHTRPASSLTVGYLSATHGVLGIVGGALGVGLGGRRLRLVDSY